MTIESKLLCSSIYTPVDLIPIVGKPAAALCQLIHYRTRSSKIESDGERWLVLSAASIAEILPYSVRTIQRAIACLRDHGLIYTSRLFSHRYNQTLAYRPNYEAIEQVLGNEAQNKSSVHQFKASKCQNEPRQNDGADAAILSVSTNKTLNTSLKKQQTEPPKVQSSNPPNHPVHPEVNREATLDEPVSDCKGPQDINPELENEIVKELGHKLSRSFRELIANSPIEVIKDALIVLRTATNVKNKSGYFRVALERRFKPSDDKIQAEKNKPDPDFKEWFDLMKQAGLAMASELRDGDLWIHSIPGKPPTLYEELRSMFSLGYLKRKAGLA